MFKIIAFFIITLFARIMWGLVCGKHLHDCITSLSRSLGHEISLTPPVYIQVPVSSQESERSSGSCTKPGKWAVVRFLYQARKVSGRQVPVPSQESERLSGSRTKPGKLAVVYLYVIGFSLFLRYYCCILELFRQCDIFVPTVWHFCSDSVIFLFFIFIKTWII
jgi:hypothetical protein